MLFLDLGLVLVCHPGPGPNLAIVCQLDLIDPIILRIILDHGKNLMAKEFFAYLFRSIYRALASISSSKT